MSRGMTRAERLKEMERLYTQYRNGFTDIEMAERLQVDRTTVFRDRAELEREIPFQEPEPGRWAIDRMKYVSSVRLNMLEALALYLAARRMSRHTRTGQLHVASALAKLAVALKQPMTEHLVAAAAAVAQQAPDAERAAVLETLAKGWAEQRKVRITHQALRSKRPMTYTLSPYLIEPSLWSDGAYVIGQSDVHNGLATFKIERIEQAILTGERFEVREDFDEQELLRFAWGIWYRDEEPVTVKLKFTGREAVTRLKESIWHPQQQLEDTGEGGCLWTAQVAEPQEMLPWIRGWGADCEVLEPKELRNTLTREAQELAELYRVAEKKKQLIAHVREKDKERQLLIEHLSAVSKISGQFAQKIGLKETGELIGWLHDFGKASETFQNYLLSGEGEINPDADGYIDPQAMRGKIDHSTAGAQLIYQKLWKTAPKEKIAAQVFALCICSHHSGLIDCIAPDGMNNFKRRIEKSDHDTHKTEALHRLQEIESAVEGLISQDVAGQIFAKLKSLQEENRDTDVTLAFKAGLLVRVLLSCVIDADRLDTADFEMPSNVRVRNYGRYQPWAKLIERLDKKLSEFENKEDKNEVDRLRTLVSQACFDFATKPKGIYQLTVPTGGGKTLASLRFALNHARAYSMERIVYVVPYTSIIDQNADEARKILEDKDENGKYLDRVVLEHHSNLTPEEESRRQNLLAQNWDAPVVFTTQVQFLEALFGSGTRSVRRMHHLANSVIILDEVQTIPINTIHMLNLALRFLVHTCGATAVLCTATQPPLDKLDNPYRALIITPDQRIIQNERELFEKLKRVEVFDEREVGGWSEDRVAELAEKQLQEKGSVLIVVNTKKSARALYQAVSNRQIENALLYHLSTNMCPAHRLRVLEDIKEKLKQKRHLICVSTQLVEAGVDIDFGAVIRYSAGLDSIAQAAGRCNRHGVREGFGNVWIVNPKDENVEKLRDIVIGIENARRILDDFRTKPEMFGNNRIGLEALSKYYEYYYYERRGEMEYQVGANSSVGRADNLLNLLSVNKTAIKRLYDVTRVVPDIPFTQAFSSAAKEFRVIDSPTRGVVVPYQKMGGGDNEDDGIKLIADLCGAAELEKQYKLLKRAQRYSVNLFPYEFDRLAEKGAIHDVQEGAGVFYLDKQYYSQCFGWTDEIVNDMEFLSA